MLAALAMRAFVSILLLLLLPALLLLSPWRAVTGHSTAVAVTKPPAGAATRANALLADLQFVANQGQWDDEVRYAVLGDTAGWLHDDGFTLRFERWSDRGENGCATVREQSGHVVRTRLLGAATPAFAAGATLPGSRHFRRGRDTARGRADVPAFAGVVMRGAYPGIDLAFRALADGRRGPFAYDVLLAPGADLSRLQARCEGAESIAVDERGRLHVRLPAANGVAATELVHDAPVAWQQHPSGPRPLAVAFRVIDATTYGFTAPQLDPSVPAVVDPGVVWSTYLGGGATDSVNALRWREGFGVWVAGWAGSSDFPTTAGAFRTSGAADGFVAKLDDAGSQLVFATYLGGARGDEVRGLALGPGDTPTVVGFTQSADFPVTPGALQPAYAGGSPFLDIGDAFVTRLTANGAALQSSTYLGGQFDDVAECVATAPNGDTLVAGWTSSSSFPVLPGAYQAVFPGIPAATTNGFVARVAASGQSLVYSTFVGGALHDQFVALEYDAPTGDVVAAGWTTSTDYPITANALRPVAGGLADGIVTRLNANGTAAVFSTYVGGLDHDFVYCLSLAADGTLWVGGTTRSINYPVSVNAPQTTIAGDTDAFVTQLTGNGQTVLYSTLLGGTGGDRARGIDASASGVAVVGEAGAGFPVTATAAQGTFAGGNLDGFFAHLAAGTLVYSSYFGGVAQDVLGSVVLGDGGLAAIGGWSFSPDFPTVAARQGARLGVEDGVVLMIDLATSFGDGLAIEGGPAVAVQRVGSGEHELLRATLRNLAARTLAVDAVRVLIAGAGDARARLVAVRAFREGAGGVAQPIGSATAVAADDAELELVLSDCTIPPLGVVQLRLVADVVADPTGAPAELAATIAGTTAWTVRASGFGSGPEIRVAAPGRASGPVLLLGELPGDVDADGVRTVVDVRRQVLLAGTPAGAADCDGDATLTPVDLAATREAVLGRTTAFALPASVARGAWVTLRGVFVEPGALQATLGGRVLTLGCATPRELTVRVPGDQPAGTQELVLSAAGRVVAAALVVVQ
jgi:hypothetical protein